MTVKIGSVTGRFGVKRSATRIMVRGRAAQTQCERHGGNRSSMPSHRSISFRDYIATCAAPSAET